MNDTTKDLLHTRNEIANRIANRTAETDAANKIDNEAILHIDAVINLYGGNRLANDSKKYAPAVVVIDAGVRTLKEQVLSYIKDGNVFVTINDIVTHLRPLYPEKELPKFKKQISNILSLAKAKEGLVTRIIKNPISKAKEDCWGYDIWLEGKKPSPEHIKK